VGDCGGRAGHCSRNGIGGEGRSFRISERWMFRYVKSVDRAEGGVFKPYQTGPSGGRRQWTRNLH
jgi:hypothetical protein